MTYTVQASETNLSQSSNLISTPQNNLTGRVTDVFTGKPVVGVTILVKGTKITTISQKDGSYNILLPKNSKTLVLSLIGYQPLEVAINGRIRIVVEMSVVEIDPTLW